MGSQKEQTNINPKRVVEELQNFPFKNFDEFKKAVVEGVVNVGVDRKISLDLISHGAHSSSALQLYAMFLSLLPLIATLGFITYIITTKSWILLLTLPILVICFVIFHPSFAAISGLTRSSLIYLTFIGFVWSVVSEIYRLCAFTLTLLIIWFSLKTLYNKAKNNLVSSVVKDENLLCLLWNSRTLNILFYNGNSYWSDFKVEDGKIFHYDKQ